MTPIVILGAAVWSDGSSPTLLRRTRHAARCWHAGLGDAIVACGGIGLHPPSEAEAMRQILMAEGVPDAAIHLEDRSTDTIGNLRLALPILAGLDMDSVVIVTDRYHARRALLIARHFGLRARCDCPGPGGLTWRGRIRPTLREWAALPVTALRLRRSEGRPR